MPVQLSVYQGEKATRRTVDFVMRRESPYDRWRIDLQSVADPF